MSRAAILAGVSGLALAMFGGAALADSYGGAAQDYPPNARPGQCFARVLTPEVYETGSERVLDVAEKTELRVIPAEWTTDTKTVLAKEGFTEYSVVPAAFRTVTETVVVKPGYTRIQVVPATYETVTERVMVREAYTVWKPGRGLAGTPGYAEGHAGYAPPPGPGYRGAMVDGRAYYGPTRVAPTGELLCLVEVPAEYKTYTKTVVKTPARSVEVAVPAVTRLVTRTVVAAPAHVEKHEVAAVYDKTPITVLVHPERVESVVIPATYKLIEKKKLVGGGRLEWREVICDDKLNGPLPPNAIDCSQAGGSCGPRYAPRVYAPPPPPPPPRPVYRGVTPTHSYDGERGYSAPPSQAPSAAAQVQGAAHPANMIARMQEALQVRGYYAGPVDGLYTAPTSEALLRYQKDNKMASGQLTLESARALGIWN